MKLFKFTIYSVLFILLVSPEPCLPDVSAHPVGVLGKPKGEEDKEDSTKPPFKDKNRRLLLFVHDVPIL